MWIQSSSVDYEDLLVGMRIFVFFETFTIEEVLDKEMKNAIGNLIFWKFE